MSLRGGHSTFAFRTARIIAGAAVACAFATGLYANAALTESAPAGLKFAEHTAALPFELDAVDELLAQRQSGAAGEALDTVALARELDRLQYSAYVLHQREERLLRQADAQRGAPQQFQQADLPARMHGGTSSSASAILPDSNPTRALHSARVWLRAFTPALAGVRLLTAGPAALQDHRRALHLYSIRNGAMGADDAYASTIPVLLSPPADIPLRSTPLFSSVSDSSLSFSLLPSLSSCVAASAAALPALPATLAFAYILPQTAFSQSFAVFAAPLTSSGDFS